MVPAGAHQGAEADHLARALRSRAVGATRASLGRDVWTCWRRRDARPLRCTGVRTVPTQARWFTSVNHTSLGVKVAYSLILYAFFNIWCFHPSQPTWSWGQLSKQKVWGSLHEEIWRTRPPKSPFSRFFAHSEVQARDLHHHPNKASACLFWISRISPLGAVSWLFLHSG